MEFDHIHPQHPDSKYYDIITKYLYIYHIVIHSAIQFIFNSKPLPTSDLESQYTQYIIELRKANVYSLTDFVSRQYDDITYQSDIIT